MTSRDIGHYRLVNQQIAWFRCREPDSVGPQLSRVAIDGTVYWMAHDLPVLPTNARRTAYLLPGFDEYLLGYEDRSAVLEPRYAQKTFLSSNGMFLPTIVINGCVVGTWKRALKKNEVVITASPFSSLTKAEKNAFAAAAERYGQFVGLPVTMRFGVTK
jgi:hypothetical protein